MPRFAHLDSIRTKQILANLLSNAIKFTPLQGNIVVEIQSTKCSDGKEKIYIEVKDSGVGFDDETKERIFQPFMQASDHVAHTHGGTGLGLSIVVKLVNMMGGKLDATSVVGEGSSFFFDFIVGSCEATTKEIKNVEDVVLEPLNILVAEDNKINQKVIKFLLEQQGVDCTCVKNGSEALKLFKILDFDMVFMDIFMPEMDGLEATQLIKSTEKYKKHEVPVIAVSASAFEEDIENAKNAGINHFLSKPIDTEKLKELLVKYAPKSEEK